MTARVGLGVIVMAAGMSASPSWGRGPIDVVFASRLQAPGMPTGLTFGVSPGAAAVGPDGVGFYSTLGAGSADGALFLAGSSLPAAVLRRNDALLPGGEPFYAADTVLLGRGGTGLIAGLLNVSPSGAVMALESAGARVLARIGGAAPVAGWNFAARTGSTRLTTQLLGAGNGDGLMNCTITNGASTLNGIMTVESGVVKALAFPGDAAPGLGAGAVFGPDVLGVMNLTPMAMTGEGDALFRGTAQGPGIAPGTGTAIWLGRSGSIQTVLREGEAAPGFAVGQTVLLPWAFGAASGETLLVMGRVQGPGITTSNDRCIWIRTGGGWRVLVRETDTLPGLPAGVVVDDHAIEDFRNGVALIRVTLRGPGVNSTNLVMYVRYRDGVATPVIRLGDALPGAPGATFQSNNEGDVALDADGRVLITMSTGFSDHDKLWVFDGPGIGRPLLSRGDTLTLAPGDVRTVQAVALVDRLGQQFASTDDGRVLVSVAFTDRSYALVTLDLTTCPCPADFDGSGGTPDGSDITAYFGAWLAGEAASDADCSGGTPDLTDITVFFGAWLAGGC